MNTNCPKCSSDNTQSVPLAYSSGKSSGVNYGMALGRGGTAYGAMGTTSQTELSARLSPPRHPTPMVAAWIWVLGLGTTAWVYAVNGLHDDGTADFGHGLWLIPLILTILLGRWASKSYFAAKKEWIENTEAWKTLFVCLKCAALFEPTTEQPQLRNVTP